MKKRTAVHSLIFMATLAAGGHAGVRAVRSHGHHDFIRGSRAGIGNQHHDRHHQPDGSYGCGHLRIPLHGHNQFLVQSALHESGRRRFHHRQDYGRLRGRRPLGRNTSPTGDAMTYFHARVGSVGNPLRRPHHSQHREAT